ncbi:hypothetical protein HRI_002770800 [Hibiscus trionum]|uniref:Uncharacterized protein n=1 Tax=Hibiscus trionum TaxID=183268 RepID=A0A9W7IB32_HIBTR|nr:hypothetical protein HRI_002770800 [Hibiscus trionum]
MASKLNGWKWNRDMYRSALLGVLLYVILTTCFHGFSNNSEEKTHANRANISGEFKNVSDGFNSNTLFAVQAQGLAGRSISDGFRAVVIQFLHFLVAKSLQFRYVPVLQHQPVPFMSMTFWLAFTPSISHRVL